MLPQNQKEKLRKFQKKIKYHFNDINLLIEAFTTPELGNQAGRKDYNFLEILGDAVIKLLFIKKLYQEGIVDPGIITKSKQAIENDKTLNNIAEEYFRLDEYVLKSPDQQLSGTLILADIFEAISGAIYLDSQFNLKIVENKIINIFYKDWKNLIKDSDIFSKNKLLEHLQQRFKFTPTIRCKFEKIGPDHDSRWFAKNPRILNQEKQKIKEIDIPPSFQSKLCKTKKSAEKNLYKKILEYLKKEDNY
ncbi:MAG: ribonuclease III domain-containing protein [Promethearchaeia archaeon]